MRKLWFTALCILLICSAGVAAADDVWIELDPVQQPETGEPYVITGSTTVPTGTAIVLKLYRYDAALPTPNEQEIHNLPAAFTTTMVVDGDKPIRTWTVDGPLPKSLPAGNYGYVAAVGLMYDEDKLLAVEPLQKPTLWAAAYPVSDRTVGDAVRISGTTNMPEGETVRVEVLQTQTADHRSVFHQNATVTSGNGGVNTWTVLMDTAGTSPGTYAVTLTNVLHQQGPNFRLNQASNASSWWISFDPLSDQSLGASFTISGATNFASGTPLDIAIQSSSLSVTGPDYPKAFATTATVQKGEAGINFWSIAAEIQSKHEDRYEVTVTEPETKTNVRTYVNLHRSVDAPKDAYWISMNEVRTAGADEPYVFSGSTTVPLGTVVTLDVRRIDTVISGMPEDLFSCPKVYLTSAVVIRGENGVNHWVAASALRPTHVSEKNVRYCAVAHPREFSHIPPVTRMVPGNGDWTTVDPVSDGETGDLITISGRTSLSPGEWITVEVYAGAGQKPKEPVLTKNVMIDKDSLWSVVLDTAGIRRGTYTVVVADAPYLAGPTFLLETAAEERWITIDPIPLVRKGDNFTLSGTTGMYAGAQLLVEVLPQYFEESSACASSISGMYATTVVQQGDGGNNLWSVVANTTKWESDNYSVKVSGIEVDATVREWFTLHPEGFTAPTTPTTVPQSPGFLMLSTVIGIAAVAVLSRKK